MDKRPDLTTPAADAERAMAQDMLSLPHAALSYIGTDGLPGISRIALGRDDLGAPLTLIWHSRRILQGCARIRLAR